MKSNDCVTIYIHIDVIIIDKAANLHFLYVVGIKGCEKWWEYYFMFYIM